MNANILFDALCVGAIFLLTALSLRRAGQNPKDRAWLWIGAVLIAFAALGYLIRRP
jgi:O-antigen ligase